MTNIHVPPDGAAWPPAGHPVASYDSYAEARQSAGVLTREGIPAQNLTVLSVKGSRSAGDRFAVLLGGYVMLIAVLIVALDLVDGDMLTVVALVATTLTGLAVAAVVVVAGYFRRRALRFLNTFEPPVVGNHVLLCAPGTARRAADLLAKSATQHSA